MIINWQKWMDEHHIKLRGEIPNDNRSDEVLASGEISRPEVETQSSDDARKTGSGDI